MPSYSGSCMGDAMLTSKEHYDIMAQFDKEFSHLRIEKEDKYLWPRGNVYQDGETNNLFLAYRKGYAYGKSVSA